LHSQNAVIKFMGNRSCNRALVLVTEFLGRQFYTLTTGLIAGTSLSVH